MQEDCVVCAGKGTYSEIAWYTYIYVYICIKYQGLLCQVFAVLGSIWLYVCIMNDIYNHALRMYVCMYVCMNRHRLAHKNAHTHTHTWTNWNHNIRAAHASMCPAGVDSWATTLSSSGCLCIQRVSICMHACRPCYAERMCVHVHHACVHVRYLCVLWNHMYVCMHVCMHEYILACGILLAHRHTHTVNLFANHFDVQSNPVGTWQVD